MRLNFYKPYLWLHSYTKKYTNFDILFLFILTIYDFQLNSL